MKIAITVTGQQNSGKSSTLLGLVNNFSKEPINGRIVSRWRRIYFDSRFRELNLAIYCFASSCSERSRELQVRLLESNLDLPDVLWIAVQTDGHNRENTLRFLSDNLYTVIPFNISNENNGGVWDRFDNATRDTILRSRAIEINNALKRYIIGQNLFTEI